MNELIAAVRARLCRHGAVLAAAAAAIAAVGFSAGASTPAVAAACGVVAAVALLYPREGSAARDIDEDGVAARLPLQAVTAVDLAAAVPDPLMIFDGDGAILHANRAAEAVFGASGAGTSVLLKFRSPEMQKLLGAVLAGEETARVVDYAERVPIERWFRVSALPLGGAAGLFVLVFEDQSEIRRIDRMRADFIANASHELRTPLASVAGFIETLRGPARNDAKARENFLQIMQAQTSRMARLIDDLLSLSRLEMKSTLPAGRTVELRAVIDNVVDALAPRAAETGVEIERPKPGPPVVVRGDRDELIQVFENLLENACKYGQSGGRVSVSLETASGTGPREIIATIRDFGPGIAAEHIPRITERFYRVDVDSSRAQKGTGLGLAIVKHILTRHDGRLSIKSELGKGSAFSVHLPLP